MCVCVCVRQLLLNVCYCECKYLYVYSAKQRNDINNLCKNHYEHEELKILKLIKLNCDISKITFRNKFDTWFIPQIRTSNTSYLFQLYKCDYNLNEVSVYFPAKNTVQQRKTENNVYS